MKNYLSKTTPKFQAGGGMPAPAGPEAGGGAPAGGGEDQLQAMLKQVVESQDPNMALQVCNQLYEAIAGGGADAGGGQGPAPMPAQGGAPTGPPMGRYGMKIKPVMKKK